MNPDTIRIVLLCCCWPVILLRIPAVRVADQSLLWFTLVFQAVGLTVLQAPVMRAIHDLTGVPRIESLISSLLASVVTVFLLRVALRISSPDEVSARWSRRAAIYCAATIVTMIVTFTLVTAQHLPTRDRFLPVPGQFTAHSVYWIAYLTYMIITTGATVLLFWRQIFKVTTPVLRVALVALAIATTSFLIFLGLRVAALFSTAPQLPEFGVYVSSIYSIGVTTGCSLAIIMPLSRSVAAWWHANQLYSLWRALYDALPQIALHPPRSRFVDALMLRDSRHRLNRRIVEIRDGMLIMREWITPAGHERIVKAMPDEASATACWLKQALKAKAAGAERVAKPLDLVRQGGVDQETERRWLTAVAKAWVSPLVVAYDAPATTEHSSNVG